MDKATVSAMVSNPHQMNMGSTELLAQLVDQYPYCSTFQVLYTKQLHATEDIQYPAQLKLAAIKSGSRKRLFELVMQPSLRQRIVSQEAALEAPIPVDSPEEVNAEETALETTSKAESAIEIELPEQVTKTLESTEIPATDRIQELEQQILVEAIHSSISLEVSEPLEQENLAQEAQELATAETIDPTPEEVPTQAETAVDQTPRSFTDWLKYKSEAPAQEAASPKKAPSKSTIDSIMEKFIEEAPQITPKKQEFFSPSSVAKLSLLDNDEFVTETLANIYRKQGNFKKALKAYEQLRLKYPEKSTYFAGLIAEVEAQKNKK